MATLQSQPPRVTQAETDQQMLDWLRKQLSHFSENGTSRRYADSIVSRFAELIESQATFKRCMDYVQDAQKLAMAQMQIAQSAMKQVERQLALVEKHERNNGKALPAPAVDLKALPAPAVDLKALSAPAVDLKGE
jgi:hypothetical protein